MTKPKIFVTRKLPQAIIDMLSTECDIAQWSHDEPAVPRDVLLRDVREAHGGRMK